MEQSKAVLKGSAMPKQEDEASTPHSTYKETYFHWNSINWQADLCPEICLIQYTEFYPNATAKINLS